MRALLVIKRGHDYLMLIGYKLLGNEVLLPMKFLCSNGFRFVDAVRSLIEELKQASENKDTKRSTIYCTGHINIYTLRAFGRPVQHMSQHHVTMLQDVALRYCKRLAKPLGLYYRSYWSVTLVLTFVAALKRLHRVDIVRECNSLKKFALFVMNKELIARVAKRRG